jgi:beta-lactamase regulating signal transducer with metallopeptidase domain
MALAGEQGIELVQTFCAICRWLIIIPAAFLKEAREKGATWICTHEERHASTEFRL